MRAPLRTILQSLAVGALFLASTVGAAGLEKAQLAVPGPKKATCSCKGPSDCTCPKDKCKCKACGKAARPMIKPLSGAQDSTRLPDTARVDDARGGVAL